MWQETTEQHCTLEDFYSYSLGRMSDAEAESILQHLKTCGSCLKEAAKISSLMVLEGSCTAEAHREAFLHHRLIGVLEQAEKGKLWLGWWNRIRAWREDSHARMKTAWRVILGPHSSVTRILDPGIDRLIASGQAATAALVGYQPVLRSPVRTRGSVGVPRGAMEINATGNEIEIRIPAGKANELPLVLLAPVDESGEPRLRPFSLAESLWTARFRNVPPGDFLLAIEPFGSESE